MSISTDPILPNRFDELKIKYAHLFDNSGTLELYENGWYNIVAILLKQLNENNSAKIYCIKEKWGTLRIIYEGNELDNQCVKFAEDLSCVCCIKCGKEGQLCTDDYYQVLCAKCI